MLHAILFNGLGRGETRKREQLAINYLGKRGLHVEHYHINWLSEDPFDVLLHDATEATQKLLKRHGRLAIIGSSAGGSMAINVFSKLQDENVQAVSLCGRLHLGNYDPSDKRSLDAKAYIGTSKASQSFFDSVTYCDQIAIPAIKNENLHKITVIKQLTDLVVPRETMDIPGIEPIVVPGFGHGMGIALAAMKLPEILTRHE